MLSKQFGMKEPSSINATMKRQTKIPLSNLVSIGRNLTLEQYFAIKDDFEADPKAKARMIKDRETYIVYKDDEGAKDAVMRDVSSDSSGSPANRRAASDSSDDARRKKPLATLATSGPAKPKLAAKQSQSTLARFMPTEKADKREETRAEQPSAWQLLRGMK